MVEVKRGSEWGGSLEGWWVVVVCTFQVAPSLLSCPLAYFVMLFLSCCRLHFKPQICVMWNTLCMPIPLVSDRSTLFS